MAWIKVENYVLQYNTKEKTASILIRYRAGGTVSGQMITITFTPSGNDAVFVADLLRNEQPVHFNPDTGVISTADETVGEEEGK